MLFHFFQTEPNRTTAFLSRSGNYGQQRKKAEQGRHTDARGRASEPPRTGRRSPRPPRRTSPCAHDPQSSVLPLSAAAPSARAPPRTLHGFHLTRRLGPGGAALPAVVPGGGGRPRKRTGAHGRRRPTAAGTDAGPQSAAGLCRRPGPPPARRAGEGPRRRDRGAGRRPPLGAAPAPPPRPQAPHRPRHRRPPGSELPAPLPLPAARPEGRGLAASPPTSRAHRRRLAAG